MNTETLNIEKEDLRKLLATGNGDAMLLYTYLRCGNDPAQASRELNLSPAKVSCAGALLRQLGLWIQERPAVLMSGERLEYSEKDVLSAMNTDGSFRMLYGEVQRQLGRTMNTEELKILLGFDRYLGLPAEVISVLVSYCKDRARLQGKLRNPSLRTIEKEAYHWAELGIDTLEEAAAYIQSQNVRRSRMSQLMQLLQIRGRNLTPAEEKYAQRWLDMGFDGEAITMAYEKTCLNTGGLNWPYMNKILTRWHESGIRTGQQAAKSDQKRTSTPTGASGELGQAELEAIQRVLREE